MEFPTNEEEMTMFLAMHAVLINVQAYYNLLINTVTCTIQHLNDDEPLKYSMIDRISKQVEQIERLLHECDTSTINNLRINRHTFVVLCDLVRQKGVSDSKYVSIEEKVATFLSILAHHKKNRIIAYDFRRSGHTISRYFHEVLNAVVMLGPELFVRAEPEPSNFKTGYQKHLETELQKKIPGVDIKASPHIDSKLKTWKKQYQTINTMVGLSGFTFNHTLHMVVNDEEDVWEKYLKEDPNAKEIRRKSFPFYNDWCEIWGNDRATGEFAETPTDAALGAQQHGIGTNAAHPHDLDAPVGVGDNIDTPKLVAAPKKRATPEPRKRRRLNDEIREMSKSLKEGSGAMTEVAKHFGSMVTKMSHDRDKRQELDNLIQPLELSIGDHVRVIGLFSAKPHLLDAFLGFKNDEARHEMVKLILDGTLV